MRNLLVLVSVVTLWSSSLVAQSNMLRLKASDLGRLAALAEEHPETRHLVIKRAKLTSIPTEVFLFPNLDSLDLYNNKIDYLPDSVWQMMSSLRYLRMGKNPMRHLPSGIQHLQSLNHLDLWNAEIETIHESIFDLSALKYIDVRATRLSRDLLDNLRNGLPDEVEIKATWQCNCR